jgi:hypothetical protein
MIKNLQLKQELGTESDLWNCGDNEPEYLPYTVAALVLCDGDLKQVSNKVIELLKKSIEHDVIMKQALPKKSFWRRIIGK